MSSARDDPRAEGGAPVAGARRRAALRALRALHDEIDRAAAGLAAHHAERLRCGRGCSACCVDDLTVAAVEAERIRAAHPALLADEAPHPSGACALLDAEGACRVYGERPSVCRSQGLPLRLLVEDEQGEIREHRDICPLNVEGGPPLEALEEDACWLIGPFELRLAAIEAAFTGEEDTDATRVPLRALFAGSARIDGQGDERLR